MADHQINKGNPRFAELDGLRALAVVSVLLFHCELPGIFNNGFYGVDIFFAISGFIITALLIKEHRDNGDFRFRAFYFRRLKRLLPPVFALIGLTAILAAATRIAPEGFRRDVPAALAYMSNLWQIIDQQSYFDNTPRMLKHLWSLAVEEQFYFMWPPIAWQVLKRYGAKCTGLAALALALASPVWMAYLFGDGSDGAVLNRIYLGTDSHAMGLLTGAALAGFWNPWAKRLDGAAPRPLVRMAAMLALTLLGWMVWQMDPTHALKYRGSFLLAAVLTAVTAYGAMSEPGSLLARLLGSAAVQWFGTRSYSLYLVHWPLLVCARLVQGEAFPRWACLLAALAATCALAEAMYRQVELRCKDFSPGILDGDRRKAVCVVAYSGAATALFALMVQAGVSAPETPPAPAVVIAAAPVFIPDTAPPEEAAPVPAAVTAEAEAETIMEGGDDVWAIGDSVMLGASAHLIKTIPGIRIDAHIGRQASEGLKAVLAWRAASGKASTVLVHLGTNGYINEAQFRALLAALADRTRVIVINVHAERRWAQPNNAMIARLAPEFPNVQLIDWAAVSAGQPQYFVGDGIHLTPSGMRAMAAQIKQAVGGPLIAAADYARRAPAPRATRPIRLAAAKPADTAVDGAAGAAEAKSAPRPDAVPPPTLSDPLPGTPPAAAPPAT